MIRRVTAYKSNGKTKYSVLYTRSEKRYTNDNLPKSVLTFIQTHPYEKLGETRTIFR